MASVEHEQDSDNLVTVICTEFNGLESKEKSDNFDEEIVLSTSSISSWDMPSILDYKLLKIEVNRYRLIEESSYFRGLLSGSFSESALGSISINWNVESFVSVLRVIFGCHVEISSDNFIPLNEAALFFGVETLLLKCRVWLEEVTAFQGLHSPQLCLDDLIYIWKYGLEHANDFILQPCTSYLARNFMWALSFNSFNDVPYELLCSCIRHPDLTVDSEKNLCNAILVWLIAKTAKPEDSRDILDYDKIRASLLPLWFAAGKRRCHFFSKVADEAIATILSLAKHPSMSSTNFFRDGDIGHLRIRLTKYTKKVDLSGCPQITPWLFIHSMLPAYTEDSMLRKIIEKSFVNHANIRVDTSQIPQVLKQMLTFEAVHEVDISNCPSLSLDSAVDCLCKSFPSLRKLRAAYFLNFKTKKLPQLVQKIPLLTTLDLTLDINPAVPPKISVISSSSVPVAQGSAAPLNVYSHHSAASFSYTSRPLLSNITKLDLEGRTDINDSNLQHISEICISLNYVNMKGCMSVTDHGISAMILKCKKLRTLLVCDTYFGNYSIRALCSGNLSESQQSEQPSQLTAYKLQDLHIGGCCAIDEVLLTELLSGAGYIRSLCLREIQLVDNALYRFSGAFLEMLDVSDTKVSCAALSHVIRRNPNLKCVKTRGCTHLLPAEIETKERKLCNGSYTPEGLYTELGKSCKLEEIGLGWGFSFLSLEALKPAIGTLRTMTIGLGGSLGHNGLKLLPTICPLLETLILYFQVISDSVIVNIAKALPHLQFLALCYCNGVISSLSFKFRMPNLRNLKLERVTPWMTNKDLATLAENCTHLIKLSLIGCMLLNSESQDIISSGWPGLTSLHLEECGEITASGVRSLLHCYALEDLILRHTGPGIPRNFIIYAASKLPMLRKISLDTCDAREGDFDIPTFSDRYFLSIVKIARCKIQKGSIGLRNLETRRNPVHKETLVLVWNSERLVRTVVKERL